MRARRILLSCRDPGGVGHVLALLDAFRQRGGFEMEVVASGVGLRMLQEAGECAGQFALPSGHDCVQPGESVDDLRRAARGVLDELEPDLVLASLSSYGVGVDEALVAVARCPTLVMQDFWGDANLGLGVPADLYLALDDFAVRLSRRRWGITAVPVGSPKHSRYRGIDVTALRREARARIEVDESQALVGFFGQSPEIPGHESAFRDFVTAIAEIRPRPVLLLRQHLKFHDRREEQAALARAAALRVIDVSDESSVEPWLAACDVVGTPFSLCALDHAYLSAYSRAPIGVVVFLLPNREIQLFMEESCGLKQFPTVDKGIGRVARTARDIASLVQDGLKPAHAESYFNASRVLRDEDACRHIVEIVESRTAAVVPSMREPT